MDGPRGYGLPMAGGLHGVDGSSGDVSGTSLRPDGPHDAFLHESLMQGDELRARSREQERLPTVIVNYLPPTLTEAEFHALFSKCGEVLEAKIVRNHRDGRSLGFGFITYTSDESAHAAIMSLTGYEIRGKRLKVSFSLPQSKMSDSLNVFVSGLPRSFGEPELNALVAPFGDVVNCKILRDAAGNPRGTGFARFINRKHGEAAIMGLHGKVLSLTEGVRAYYLERLGEEPPMEGFVLNVEVAESSREEGKLRGRRPRGPMDRMGMYGMEPEPMHPGYGLPPPSMYGSPPGFDYGHPGMRGPPTAGMNPTYVGYPYYGGYESHGMAPQPAPAAHGGSSNPYYPVHEYRAAGYGGDAGYGGHKSFGVGVGGRGHVSAGRFDSVSAPPSGSEGNTPGTKDASMFTYGRHPAPSGSFHDRMAYDAMIPRDSSGSSSSDFGRTYSGRSGHSAQAMDPMASGVSGDQERSPRMNLTPPFSAGESSTHHLVYGQPGSQVTSGGEVAGTGGSSPPPSLFVFDLPEGGDEEFLSGLFSPYGRVDSVKVARGSDGRSQGYGYVNMAHWQDAKAALGGLNGRKFGASTLQVSIKRQ